MSKAFSIFFCKPRPFLLLVNGGSTLPNMWAMSLVSNEKGTMCAHVIESGLNQHPRILYHFAETSFV